MDQHLIEKRMDSKEVYRGHFLNVQQDNVRLPDGKEGVREYILHPGAVVILPVFDDGTILLERQFRYPVNRVFVEFPAGKIDAGEDPLVCARRELQEETGYTARDWSFVCTIHNAIAYSDEHLEIYLAKGLTAGPSALDDGEFLDIFTAPLDDLMTMVREGQVTDVKTIIGAFWLEKLVKAEWRL